MKSREQCVGCVYWKAGAGGVMWDAMYMCHHLLETGKRRIDRDGECLSRTTERQRKQKARVPKANKVKKKVKAVEDNIVFESMTAAENHYKLSHGRVSEVVNKPHRMARGQHFITI